MVFVNSQGPLPGMDFAAPDVYLQATPAGPVPTPLVSVGMRATETPTCMRFFVMCMPAHNQMNDTPATVSGPGPGVLSGMTCSQSRSAKGSSKLIIQGAPATRAFMDPTMQNGLSPNSVGTTIVPSQIRLMNPSL